jgi:hypothetical protein
METNAWAYSRLQIRRRPDVSYRVDMNRTSQNQAGSTLHEIGESISFLRMTRSDDIQLAINPFQKVFINLKIFIL